LTVVSPRIANAAESVPNLQWPAISVGYRDMPLVESPAAVLRYPVGTWLKI